MDNGLNSTVSATILFNKVVVLVKQDSKLGLQQAIHLHSKKELQNKTVLPQRMNMIHPLNSNSGWPPYACHYQARKLRWFDNYDNYSSIPSLQRKCRVHHSIEFLLQGLAHGKTEGTEPCKAYGRQRGPARLNHLCCFS